MGKEGRNGFGPYSKLQSTVTKNGTTTKKNTVLTPRCGTKKRIERNKQIYSD